MMADFDDTDEVPLYEREEGEDLDDDEGCTRCGMKKEAWGGNGGKGASLGGEKYCCEGCAEETGCTCEEERNAAEAPLKKKRGRGRTPKASNGNV